MTLQARSSAAVFSMKLQGFEFNLLFLAFAPMMMADSAAESLASYRDIGKALNYMIKIKL